MAKQDIEPWNRGSGDRPEADSARAAPVPGASTPSDAATPTDTGWGPVPPVAGGAAAGRLSIARRMLLLATLPATVCALVFEQLGRRGAGPTLSVLAAVALAALGGAYAMLEARRLRRPMQTMIEQCEQLATHYCGQLPARSRCELSTLASAYDAMSAALVTHANTSRQLYLAEAQNALDLQRQYALMQMLRNLASVANRGEALESALQNSLREIGTYLDWPVGRLVLVARKKTGEVDRERAHWYAPDPVPFSNFIDASDASVSEVEHSGLIGRAQQSHLSHWVCDLGRMDGWPQREVATACGLRTGFVIPISSGADQTAYIEFFSDHRIEASAEMLELVEAISVELWNTANRHQSDSSLRWPSVRARRLAAIAENMEEAIALVSAQGRIEWANGGLTRLVGLSAPQVIGKDLAEVLFADEPSSVAECRRRIEAGARTLGLVLPTQADAANAPSYELQVQPLPGEGIGADEAFVVIRDATHQRATQETPDNVPAGAGREDEARLRLFAEMSQALRAPINQVLGVADLLLSTALDERQRALVNSLCRPAQAMLGSMSDMLALSRLRCGQLTLQSLDFDLCAVLEDLVEDLAPRAHAKGIEFVSQIPPDLPAAVHGDPVRLRQVLGKLLDNAIEFTERGEVVLAVQSRVGDQAEGAGTGGQLRFVVRDTGAGMRPETLQRLLEPAAAAQMPSSRRADGAGLGLALCRGLAHLMGGTLSASSRIGEGTQFQFDVPLPAGDAAAAALAADSARSVAGKRVLIAEDNPTNRRLLSEQLTSLGMDCAIAENGRQALQMLRIAANSASPFDVAVIDMKMPFMDGVELTEKIRADSTLRSLHVIMLTSLAGWEAMARAQAGGVDVYLAKPVRRNDLVEALSNAVTAQTPGAEPSAKIASMATNTLAPVALPVLATDRPSGPGLLAAGGRAAPLHKVLEKRVVDEITAMQRSGTKDHLERLLANYENTSQSLLQSADRSLANQDAPGVVQALHSLKRASANLGALRFSRSCGEIETLARQQRLADVQARWPAVQTEHDHVLSVLHSLIAPAEKSAEVRLQEVER